MTAITRDQLETLIELQRIETERRAVQKILDQVDRSIHRLEEEVQGVAEEITGEQRQVEALRQQCQELEDKIQDNDVLIQKIEQKRRAVQTEREYQSLIKEEGQLRTLKSQMEEEMIQCMDQIETLEQSITEKEADHAELSERNDAQKQTIRQEASDSEAKHRLLREQWEAVAARTTPQLLRTFTQLKELLPLGDAVVPARNAVCNGCHMNIPPQMYNELQRFDSLKLCPFCNRILYWEST